MTCEEALVLLSGRLDGQNTADEDAQLQSHLAECEDCRRLLEDLQALDQGLLSLEADPPEDLCESVMAAIRQEAPRRKKRRRIWPATAAAAVLVLLAGAGVWAAPRTQVTESIAPMAARMVTADTTEPEAAMVNEAVGASLYSDEDAPMLFAASVSPDSRAQALADERSAPVVLLDASVPELEGLPCETLADGSLLYTLAQAGDAEALRNAYPDSAVLYLPEAEASQVSYALLLP